MKKVYCDKCNKELLNILAPREIKDSFGTLRYFPLLCGKCEKEIYGEKGLESAILKVQVDYNRTIIDLIKKLNN